MLVKKIADDWMPNEKLALKVGETIEITDPKQLILDGKVVAVGEDGQEISAYDLYGVLVENEVKDFQNYLKIKKQEALAKQLEKESKDLQEKINAAKVTEENARGATDPISSAPKEEKGYPVTIKKGK